uniref:Uncharacterized protein n=1 Tax=Romanomermis culicivorax TaxID=13658 RepID=A0A915IHY0_ROMCU
MLRLSCLPNQLCFKIRKACLPFNMKLIYNFSTDAQSQQPERAKQNIDIADRKIPKSLNKYLLCALNPILTQETQ